MGYPFVFNNYLAALLILCPINALAFNVSNLSKVKGYSVVDVTNASGTFDGAEYDKLIELDNGMIFKFTEYQYSYAYRPQVVVFGRSYSLNEVKKFYPKATSSFTTYKLLIEDDFYDVNRVK